MEVRLLSARWSPGIPWACFKPGSGNVEAGAVGRGESVAGVVHNHRAKEQPGVMALTASHLAY